MSNNEQAIAPNRLPELLAPAGQWESMKAAVSNGADAVYFGLEQFNARRRAENFPLARLGEVMNFLHDHNVRGYLALNTLIFPRELERSADLAAQAARCGVDAVIVQDLGLAGAIRRLAPTLPLHASTQMTLTGPGGIELVRRLGVSRVILARELTLDEIRHLAGLGVELEVFVHGALCVSYSGQCLASLTLGGRSANRGHCAQPCRLPYQLVVDGQLDPRPANRPYVLSPKDLCAWERVEALARMGVAGLKIEGRLKSPHYVAAAVQAYRSVLDNLAAGSRPALDPHRQEALTQSFSRGFTHGFLDGTNHADLVDGRSPKSRGQAVGKVAAFTQRGIIVELSAAGQPAQDTVHPGDGVLFESPSAPAGQEPGGRVYEVEPQNRPSRVLLTFANEADLSAVTAGMVVRKTDDPRLERELETSFARSRVCRPARLSVQAQAVVGEPLRLTVRDDQGHTVQAVGAQPLEAARKHPLTAESLREQLDRLGDTPFELGEVALVGGEAMAPKSLVNDLRRQAVADLTRLRQDAARHEVADPAAVEHLRQEAHAGIPARDSSPDPGLAADPASPPPAAHGLRLHVLARTQEQVQAIIAAAQSAPADQGSAATFRAFCDTIYLDLRDERDWPAAIRRCRDAGLRPGLATPRIARYAQRRLLSRIARAGSDTVLIRNLEALEFFRDRLGAGGGGGGEGFVGDFSLNAANDLSAATLAGLGLGRVTASLDLAESDLLDLASGFPAARIEVILHGRAAMFHTEHCVFAARLAPAGQSEGCGSPCRDKRLALRDQAGAEYPVQADTCCRNTIFAPKPSSRLDWLAVLARAGLCHFRIELVDEGPDETADVLRLCSEALARIG